MSEQCFWLSEGQFARLQPLMPNKPRGMPRVDDRRVIIGIVHVLKSGGRWTDAPAVYGPRKTLYNRSSAGRQRGFGPMSSMPWRPRAGRPPSSCWTAPTSRRTARRPAVKGGRAPGHRPLARRPHHQDPSRRRWLGPAPGHRGHARSARRCPGRARAHRRLAATSPTDRRHGLRQQWLAQLPHRARDPACRAQQPDPQAPAPLRRSGLQGAQRHRENLLQAQGLAPHRHPIQPPGRQLQSRRPHRRYRLLLVMSPEPSLRRCVPSASQLAMIRSAPFGAASL